MCLPRLPWRRVELSEEEADDASTHVGRLCGRHRGVGRCVGSGEGLAGRQVRLIAEALAAFSASRARPIRGDVVALVVGDPRGRVDRRRAW